MTSPEFPAAYDLMPPLLIKHLDELLAYTHSRSKSTPHLSLTSPETNILLAQQILAYSNHIQTICFKTTGINLTETQVLLLALATKYSDCMKGGDPDDSPGKDITARLYINVGPLRHRHHPLNQALALTSMTLPTSDSRYRPLDPAEIVYLQAPDLFGPTFDPNKDTAAQVFTQLHVKLLFRFLKQLGLENTPLGRLLVFHHYDQGINPYTSDPSPSELLLIAFISSLDKFNAAYYRPSPQPTLATAFINTLSQIKANLTLNHPHKIHKLWPIYRDFSCSFYRLRDIFFPLDLSPNPNLIYAS